MRVRTLTRTWGWVSRNGSFDGGAYCEGDELAENDPAKRACGRVLAGWVLAWCVGEHVCAVGIDGVGGSIEREHTGGGHLLECEVEGGL